MFTGRLGFESPESRQHPLIVPDSRPCVMLSRVPDSVWPRVQPGGPTVKTYEQLVREDPSIKYYAVFGLSGFGGVVAALAGISKEAGIFVGAVIFVSANTFVWLRQNPTLKQ